MKIENFGLNSREEVKKGFGLKVQNVERFWDFKKERKKPLSHFLPEFRLLVYYKLYASSNGCEVWGGIKKSWACFYFVCPLLKLQSSQTFFYVVPSSEETSFQPPSIYLKRGTPRLPTSKEPEILKNFFWGFYFVWF